MLVLSRRQQDKVVFPNLGITVHVLRIHGQAVRLGIDAPDDVRVLRHELAQRETLRAQPPSEPPKTDSHALRNRINAATIGLQLLRRQLELGQVDQSEPTLLKILDELESMETEIERFPADGRNAPSSRRYRALLVEDNVNESELLAGYLRTYNFDVTTARDGVDALEHLRDHEQPDVVLLDMNMPRLDGPGTIHIIRSNPSTAGLKVFAVTGASQEASRVDDGPMGVDRWFRKPIRPDNLIREIDRELVEVSA